MTAPIKFQCDYCHAYVEYVILNTTRAGQVQRACYGCRERLDRPVDHTDYTLQIKTKKGEVLMSLLFRAHIETEISEVLDGLADYIADHAIPIPEAEA